MADILALVSVGSILRKAIASDRVVYPGDVLVNGSVIIRGGEEVDTLETLMPVNTDGVGTGGEALRFDTGTAATGPGAGVNIKNGGYTQYGGKVWNAAGGTSIYGSGMRMTPKIDAIDGVGVPTLYHWEIGSRLGVEKWRIDQDGYVTMLGTLDSRNLILVNPVASAVGLTYTTQTAASAGPGAIQNPGYTQWTGMCWTGAVNAAAPFASMHGIIDTQVAGVPATYHLEIRERLGAEKWRVNEVGTMRTMQVTLGPTHGAKPSTEVAGYQMRNDTLADGGVGGTEQVSASSVWHGSARNTGANVTEYHDWRAYGMQITAAGVTSSAWMLQHSFNDANYGTRLSVTSDGQVLTGTTGCFVAPKTDLKETAAWIVLSAPATVFPATSDGLFLKNTESGAVARNEYSPSVRFDAVGYTAAGALYWRQSWAITNKPTDATHGVMSFDFATPPAGGAYAAKMTLSKDGDLRIGDGYAGIPALGPLSDVNTGFFFDGADLIGMSCGGTQRFSISTTAAAFAVPVSYSTTALALTTADGVLIKNTSPAVVGPGATVQISPSLYFEGHSWDTDGFSDIHTCRVNLLPASAAVTTSSLQWFFGKGAAEVAPTYGAAMMSLSSGGVITATQASLGGMTVGTQDISALGGAWYAGPGTYFGVARIRFRGDAAGGVALIAGNPTSGTHSTGAVGIGTRTGINGAGDNLVGFYNGDATARVSSIDWHGAYVVPKTALGVTLADPATVNPTANDGVLLTNNASGATGLNEYSPSLRLDGVGYTAAATYTRKSFALTNKPINATSAKWALDHSTGGGAYAEKFYVDQDGSVYATGRRLGFQGADVTAANDTTLTLGNYFDITGATQINGIAVANWTAGSLVTLQFDSNPVVKHNTAASAGFASILLAGAGDFASSAGDTLTLVYDGTTWSEVARSVI
jgi:hypothetical protein